MAGNGILELGDDLPHGKDPPISRHESYPIIPKTFRLQLYLLNHCCVSAQSAQCFIVYMHFRHVLDPARLKCALTVVGNSPRDRILEYILYEYMEYSISVEVITRLDWVRIPPRVAFTPRESGHNKVNFLSFL